MLELIAPVAHGAKAERESYYFFSPTEISHFQLIAHANQGVFQSFPNFRIYFKIAIK
jgi:hypothetical protein